MKFMTTIYLVRHGEYDNPDYLFPGRAAGFPLSQVGKEQVNKLSKHFEGISIDVLYSSPLQRTRETAAILSTSLHVPIQFDVRLVEVRTNLEGKSMKLFDETMGELSYLPENLAKGAESMQQLTRRMHQFVEEKRSENDGKTVLIVTHGDPMRFVVMKYMGLPITFAASRKVSIPLAGGYKIEFDEAGGSRVIPIVILS